MKCVQTYFRIHQHQWVGFYTPALSPGRNHSRLHIKNMKREQLLRIVFLREEE
ncbi:hypothetical protein [Nostoc sp. CMAA1605]|uniref:hypothetical protein n=1 Tax=Nostoc sp. CMAA1605 TaxID=2055159 RepID=UPI001F30C712|nr:hypothetical protein [Nostoc sp. CMAA1605]